MARAKKAVTAGESDGQTAGSVLATETAPTPSKRKHSAADMVLINQFAAAMLSTMEPHRAQADVAEQRIRVAFDLAKVAANISKEIADE